MMRRIARRGWRQLALFGSMLLIIGYLSQSLFSMQVLQASSGEMRDRYLAAVPEPQVQPPVRGTIVDANGRPLVSTVTVFKVIAYPPNVGSGAVTPRAAAAKVRATAQKLLPLLFPETSIAGAARDKKALARARAARAGHLASLIALLGSDSGYVCLSGDVESCAARQLVSETTWTRIRKLGLPGIDAEPRSMPSYPNGPLASHLLGYVTYDTKGLDTTTPQGRRYSRIKSYVGVGQYGLENYYDAILSGVPGHVSVRQDTSGASIRVGAGSDTPAQQGATLSLTLDSYVQLVVEQQLAQVVKAQHARDGGTIIVERPSDGAILAMASTPGYNPTDWHALVEKYGVAAAGAKFFTDPAISKQYEPGSTFKAFTVAAGFDAGLFNENSSVNDNGDFKTHGIEIRNWCVDACSFGGWETPRVMLQYSSNIGAAKFGQIIGPVTWYRYLDLFGFGQPTGVDLAGEATGTVRRPTDTLTPAWAPADKDTQAYGQGIAVTPLQLINAYAALANGGKLMRPHLLDTYTLAGKTYRVPPQVVRQAISPDTSRRISSLLVDSAIDGEACKALVPGYDIAAKTGTASIPSAGGNYYKSTTIASTAAYAPALDPKFVILVIVRKPDVQWGSLVAAPVVHNIAQRLFDYYGIPRSDTPVQPSNAVCKRPGST